MPADFFKSFPLEIRFSIVVPVYNRPGEVGELLQSIAEQDFSLPFEVVIVEDGSDIRCKDVIEKYMHSLDLKYFYKENSGPGQSRNFGMKKASGNYFIILDSDVILPKEYLKIVNSRLEKQFTDAYGGPDASLPDFTPVQKGINYAMTSFLTTGGLRGSETKKKKFQLRSFNLGLSKRAFKKTGGFARQHYGEDIELTFRLWQAGFTTQFIPEAYVFHKRRTSFRQFFRQTFNFGAARPVLNTMFPKSAKITYWFPSLFLMGGFISLVLFVAGFLSGKVLFFLPAFLFGLYFTAIFFNSAYKERHCTENTCTTDAAVSCPEIFKTAFYSVIAALVQFSGYGLGFLRSVFRIKILRKDPKTAFPEMFR